MRRFVCDRCRCGWRPSLTQFIAAFVCVDQGRHTASHRMNSNGWSIITSPRVLLLLPILRPIKSSISLLIFRHISELSLRFLSSWTIRKCVPNCWRKASHSATPAHSFFEQIARATCAPMGIYGTVLLSICSPKKVLSCITQQESVSPVSANLSHR